MAAAAAAATAEAVAAAAAAAARGPTPTAAAAASQGMTGLALVPQTRQRAAAARLAAAAPAAEPAAAAAAAAGPQDDSDLPAHWADWSIVPGMQAGAVDRVVTVICAGCRKCRHAGRNMYLPQQQNRHDGSREAVGGVCG